MAALRSIDSDRKIRRSQPLVAGVFNQAAGVTSAAFSSSGEGLRDHFMRNYLAALE